MFNKKGAINKSYCRFSEGNNTTLEIVTLFNNLLAIKLIPYYSLIFCCKNSGVL